MPGLSVRAALAITAQAMQAKIIKLKAIIMQNHETIQELLTKTVSGEGSQAKVGKPIQFNREQTKLELFLLQIEVYLKFNL